MGGRPARCSGRPVPLRGFGAGHPLRVGWATCCPPALESPNTSGPSMASTNPKTYESIPPRKVAFLGLGVMGFPMAGHLALAGHDVVVYNRSAAKSQAWTGEFKGASAATPREAAAGRDFVFCCVGNDDDLRSVVLGENGALAG